MWGKPGGKSNCSWPLVIVEVQQINKVSTHKDVLHIYSDKGMYACLGQLEIWSVIMEMSLLYK